MRPATGTAAHSIHSADLDGGTRKHMHTETPAKFVEDLVVAARKITRHPAIHLIEDPVADRPRATETDVERLPHGPERLLRLRQQRAQLRATCRLHTQHFQSLPGRVLQ